MAHSQSKKVYLVPSCAICSTEMDVVRANVRQEWYPNTGTRINNISIVYKCPRKIYLFFSCPGLTRVRIAL